MEEHFIAVLIYSGFGYFVIHFSCSLELLFVRLIGNISRNAEWRLMTELLKRYQGRQSLRAVETPSQAVNVTLSMKMVQIIELKEKIQIFSASVWFEQVWHDPLLTWNTDDYKVSEISIPPSDVWVPDIVLANNVNQDYMGRAIGLNEPVLVSSSGRVRWLTPTILDGFCKQFVRYFPFDDQYCPLKFYSWNYDMEKLMLTGKVDDMLSNYTESGTWTIINIMKKEHISVKDKLTKMTVTFVVHIRRKVFYYFVYLIAPCVLTAILATLVFYLPAASGERMVVGCTILLALSVFFLLATNYIPETSEDVPLVGRYYSMVILEVCIALMCTAWVLRYHYHNPAMGGIPRWIRVYIFGYISKLVRVKVPEEMLAKNTPVVEDTEDGRNEKTEKYDPAHDNLRGLALMAAQISEEEELGKIQAEWQLAAEILNQLFMIIYIIAAFLTFGVIFINAPGIIYAHPEPSMDEIVRVY